MGRCAYGLELKKALRRMENGLKHTMWGLWIRVPINKIASGIALMRWGDEDGRNGSDESIKLGDCPRLDPQAFGQFVMNGDKLEDRPKQPTTSHMIAKDARQQSSLYAAEYGEERLDELLDTVGKLIGIHEERPGYLQPLFR